MLSFRDRNKSSELDGDLSKTMTSYKFKKTHSSPVDRKVIYGVGKEMKSNNNQVGRKSNRDTSLIKLFESIAIMASGISTIISRENPNEICDRLKILLQEKQAGEIFKKTDEEIVAIAEKLLEYNCISTKQHKFLLLKYLN